jgi:hypothetical protein
MRLWTLHPKYLDSAGLVAVWREALLAQAVLRGKTKGYRNHPQLERFRTQPGPLGAVAAYLVGIYDESLVRGYRFDRAKIGPTGSGQSLTATTGQLTFEWKHLLAKLALRAPAVFVAHSGVHVPEPHPLFTLVPGPVAEWERSRSP